MVTEWSEFRNPDFEQVAELLKHPAIFDGRNVYSLDRMQELSFYYESIGRRVVHAHVHDHLKMHHRDIVRERGVMD